MTYDEVIKYFGSCYRVSKEVGFSSHTPANWRKIGYIPADAQSRIQKYTNGKLRFCIDHLESKRD